MMTFPDSLLHELTLYHGKPSNIRLHSKLNGEINCLVIIVNLKTSPLRDTIKVIEGWINKEYNYSIGIKELVKINV